MIIIKPTDTYIDIVITVRDHTLTPLGYGVYYLLFEDEHTHKEYYFLVNGVYDYGELRFRIDLSGSRELESLLLARVENFILLKIYDYGHAAMNYDLTADNMPITADNTLLFASSTYKYDTQFDYFVISLAQNVSESLFNSGAGELINTSKILSTVETDLQEYEVTTGDYNEIVRDEKQEFNLY